MHSASQNTAHLRWQFGLPAAHAWYDRAYSHCWDFMHGVSTCGDIHPRDLQMPAELQAHSAYYMPTHPKHLRLLFDSLPLSGKQYSLVDFGSGKGRVLLTAMSYPFREVVGVEAAPELHAIAESNLRHFRGRRACSDAKSVCMDVRDYELPRTNTVFYFFSPFTEPIMRPVLEKIVHSLEEHPRDSFLVYVNPECRHLVDQSGMFQVFGASAYSTVWRFAPRNG